MTTLPEPRVEEHGALLCAIRADGTLAATARPVRPGDDVYVVRGAGPTGGISTRHSKPSARELLLILASRPR